jgi:hypothetical protein
MLFGLATCARLSRFSVFSAIDVQPPVGAHGMRAICIACAGIINNVSRRIQSDHSVYAPCSLREAKF